MDKLKFKGRNDPPNNIRAQDFRDEENRVVLDRQRNYTKEERAKMRIPVVPNVPSWARGFYNAVHAIRVGHDIEG